MKKDVKIYKKMIDRPPLLEEPFAQTLSGKKVDLVYGVVFFGRLELELLFLYSTTYVPSLNAKTKLSISSIEMYYICIY